MRRESSRDDEVSIAAKISELIWSACKGADTKLTRYPRRHEVNSFAPVRRFAHQVVANSRNKARMFFSAVRKRVVLTNLASFFGLRYSLRWHRRSSWLKRFSFAFEPKGDHVAAFGHAERLSEETEMIEFGARWMFEGFEPRRVDKV